MTGVFFESPSDTFKGNGLMHTKKSIIFDYFFRFDGNE